MRVAKSWGRTSNWLLRASRASGSSCAGLEKIPPGALLVAAKHQSVWETFTLLTLFDDPAYVLQARADVDSRVRLVRVEIRHDPGRSRVARRRACRHDRRAHAPSSRAGGRSSSFPKARAPRRARRPPTSRASRISTRRPACRACRSRSIPGCSGRAASSCAIRARSCWRCSIRSRRGFRARSLPARLEREIETATDRLIGEAKMAS